MRGDSHLKLAVLMVFLVHVPAADGRPPRMPSLNYERVTAEPGSYPFPDAEEKIVVTYWRGGCCFGQTGYRITLMRDGDRAAGVLHAGALAVRPPREEERFTRQVELDPADFQRVLDLFDAKAFKKPANAVTVSDGATYEITVLQGDRTSRARLGARWAEPALPLIRTAEELVGYDESVQERVDARWGGY